MPTMIEYAPGTRCWVDLSTTDLGAAKNAKKLGATVVVEPMDMMDVGRMAGPR